jgi:hypothetical protein
MAMPEVVSSEERLNSLIVPPLDSATCFPSHAFLSTRICLRPPTVAVGGQRTLCEDRLAQFHAEERALVVASVRERIPTRTGAARSTAKV